MQKFTAILKKTVVIFVLVGCPLIIIAQGSGTKNSIEITGKVNFAADGLPLSGINVSVQGFSADLTDDEGNFKIEVPSVLSSIVLSGEGFQTKEVALKGRTYLSIILYEESFVSVYKNARLPNHNEKAQSQIVGAVSSIDLDHEKFRTSAESPENYLQGKVAGLNVLRCSGAPGMGAGLLIRGYSSLYTTNAPLVIVDGMIYDLNEHGNSLLSNHYNNPLNYIDIKDIDNISVIKDATSMYGAKGANGAILITTSGAGDLTTKIDFSSYAGINSTPGNIPVMDAHHYRSYLLDVLQTGGLTSQEIQSLPFMNDERSSPGYYNYHNDTDWQKEVMKSSLNKNYYLKVRGGDHIAKYSLSLGYLDQGGIVENTGLQRYNTRFNADLNMSPRLKFNANLAFTYGEQSLSDQGIAPKTNPLYLGLIKSPFLAPNVISEDGALSPNFSGVDIFNVSNPSVVVNNMIANNQFYRFFGSINADYEISEHLTASTKFGVTFDKARENFFIPRHGVLADTLSNAIAYSRMGNQVQRFFSLYNDTRIAYRKTFNNIHSFQANLGLRYSDNSFENDFGLGYNSATDELITIGTGSNTLRRAGGDIGKWRWLNYYSGVDYNFLNKYFVSLNVAMDGSSRFRREADGINLFNHKFGVFPSVGAGWLVSSESFMANVDFIEMIKLRATYSITGNDDIGNYSARQYYVSQNLLGIQGLVRGNIANPALQWESVKKMNLGLDLSVLNEKVTMNIDVFQNVTDNMLIQEPLSSPSGLSFMLTNNGGMTTRGIEISLNTRLVNSSNLKWDAGFTLSTYKNEITRLPDNQIITKYAGANILSRVGHTANLFYGYKTNGVYVSDEEAYGDGYQTRTPGGTYENFKGGDVRFIDFHADRIIDEKDMVVIGDPNPDFVGMFNSRLSYKRFTFDVLFTYSVGNDIYNYSRARLESMSGYENQTQAAINRWRSNGQVTNMPKASFGDPLGNARFSDRWIEDGSYLRLRTLSFNYDVPVKSNPYVKNASVYVTANNLFTITNYLGYDPEFSALGGIFTQGIDVGMVPQFRSWLLGIRLGL